MNDEITRVRIRPARLRRIWPCAGCGKENQLTERQHRLRWTCSACLVENVSEAVAEGEGS